MVGTKLFLLFITCAAVVAVNGIAAVQSREGSRRTPCPAVVLPLTRDMWELEMIVRCCVYPAVSEYPETLVIAVNMGADGETLGIFRRLTEHSCRCEIINCEE